MPKFVCSYAYDIPHFADFVVEAQSEADAENMNSQALRDKRFHDVPGVADYDSVGDERVFVSRELSKADPFYPTMAQVIQDAE